MQTHEVIQKLDQKRETNRRNRLRRLRWLETHSPEYSELVSRRNELYARAAILEISGRSDEAEALKAEAETLSDREPEILKELGLPPDYLKEHYDCPICKDVGFTPDGGMCSCLKTLLHEAAFSEYDLTERFAEDNFDNFDLNIFSTEVDRDYNISPREMIKLSLNMALDYCLNYGPDSPSLLLYGKVGTGKTYMISCIVNALFKKNVDLIYISAPNVVNLLFDDIRKKSENKDSNKERFKNVELLIIDDLGTEMDTEFTRSAICEILDERQLLGKKTIITTNYSPNEMLNGRYPERMVSRIFKYYDRLIFIGPDLRRPARP